MDDVIAAMQDRNRRNVHTVLGVRAALQGRAQLIERDGVPNLDLLVRELESGARKLVDLADALQRDSEPKKVKHYCESCRREVTGQTVTIHRACGTWTDSEPTWKEGD